MNKQDGLIHHNLNNIMNHRLQIWLPFINQVDKHEENWRVNVDFIVLDNTRGVVKLLTTMMDLNK